jgi:hypothetical protein
VAGTTKGTGGDILILEEAAYVDSDFFYETVAPLLLVGVTSLICISTLTSDIKYVLCFWLMAPLSDNLKHPASTPGCSRLRILSPLCLFSLSCRYIEASLVSCTQK